MSLINEELKKVKAFVFDVDGVLSKDTSPVDINGDPVRTANVKDGFAIRQAINAGYIVALITGGYTERVRKRYEKIGVKYYYDDVSDKVQCLDELLEITGISADNVLFMGDDLVDYHVMMKVGFPTCPFDAVDEIKEISKYISNKNGGEGCVRDVIENTLRIQENWFFNNKFHDKAF